MKSIQSSQSNEGEIPEVYYVTSKDRYYMKDSSGNFRDYRKSALSTRLKFEYKMGKESQDMFFADIFLNRVIDCVSEIGGMKKGLISIDGKKVLIPREQRRIEPKKGDWCTIKKFLHGMLGDEQLEWYLGWLKTWLLGFYDYKFVPGQVLICIGETSSGKTLLKEIHNVIFDGGGQPLKYMTGATVFNGELCSSCSWYIDDKLNDLGHRGKKKLKAECKEMAVAGELRFEFKHQTAFTASPCTRLLICCNYTEDSVSVIPDIDESTQNKISILDCRRKQMPMPARTASEREAFWGRLKSEMSAFIYHILYEHTIDEGFADKAEERMGVRGYHNPRAMAFVEAHSNDGSRLLAIIDCLRENFLKGNGYWEGNAGSLANFLKQCGLEKLATPISIGRFLNQRIDSGSKLVSRIGHREYRIDLSDPLVTKEEEKEEIEAPESIAEEINFNTSDLESDDEYFGMPKRIGKILEELKYQNT